MLQALWTEVCSNPFHPYISIQILSTSWFEVVYKLNNDVLFLLDQVFLILYKELYYRHIYNKLKVRLLTHLLPGSDC